MILIGAAADVLADVAEAAAAESLNEPALARLAAATGGAGHARHALTLAERAGFRALRGQAMTVLAEIHLALRKPADAVEFARHALAIHRETGHRLGQARTRAVLARIPPTR